MSLVACTTMQQHTSVALTTFQSRRAFPLSFQNEYLQTGGSYCRMFPCITPKPNGFLSIPEMSGGNSTQRESLLPRV